MPLVLSLRVGQDFYVGDEQYSVESVKAENDFVLRRTSDNKRFAIGDEGANEIEADVLVSAGDAVPTAKITIEAPSEITILRGDKYRKPQFTGGAHARHHREEAF